MSLSHFDFELLLLISKIINALPVITDTITVFFRGELYDRFGLGIFRKWKKLFVVAVTLSSKWDHSFSTNVKFSKKQKFLTP